jgi:hypothetical protein
MKYGSKRNQAPKPKPKYTPPPVNPERAARASGAIHAGEVAGILPQTRAPITGAILSREDDAATDPYAPKNEWPTLPKVTGQFGDAWQHHDPYAGGYPKTVLSRIIALLGRR